MFTRLQKAIENLGETLDILYSILSNVSELQRRQSFSQADISFDATSFDQIVGRIGTTLKESAAYNANIGRLGRGLSSPRLVTQASRFEQRIKAHNMRLRYLLVPLEL